MRAKNNNFFRNVIVLMSGSIGAQLINIIAIPIITRMYGPEAYGLMGSFVAITAILIPISALTYPIGIVLPKKDSEARGITKVAIYTTIVISSIFLLILILFKDLITNLFNIQEISSLLYLIPFIIFSSGFLQIAEQWMIRKKMFSVSAKAVFFQAIVVNSSNIGFGIINPTSTILIIISSAKNTITTILMYVFSLKKRLFHPQKYYKNHYDLKKIARKYRDFPLYRAPMTFLNDFSQSFPILMLASFFGPASVGFYSISRTVLSLPTQLIGKAVGDVFYPHINEAANKKKDIIHINLKVTGILAILGIIPFGTIIILGPSLFSMVFGEEWEVGGVYARWIAFWTYFSFINQPSVRLLSVLNAQRFHLLFTIFLLLVRVVSILLGYLVFNSDVIAIALFSISSGIVSFFLIFITLYLSKKFMENNHTNIYNL